MPYKYYLRNLRRKYDKKEKCQRWRRGNICALPKDIIKEIAKYLDYVELCQFKATCSKFYFMFIGAYSGLKVWIDPYKENSIRIVVNGWHISKFVADPVIAIAKGIPHKEFTIVTETDQHLKITQENTIKIPGKNIVTAQLDPTTGEDLTKCISSYCYSYILPPI